ncbi:titin homolog [Lineus longissimus]|uniref:titin homolog n=1 Tax=Lineus longissimus TaxID=88925 RepID=UPI002B4CF579
MLSSLSQGVGSLNGDVSIDLDQLKGRQTHYTLPPVLLTKFGPPPYHHHGVTISSRIKSAQSSTRSEKPDGELILPKTFCTRKGALLLFTAPEKIPGLSEEDREFIREKMRISNIQDLSNRIGTLHRLTKSVLMYGDEGYEKESTSIADEENKVILKFLHGLDERAIDMRAQPGGDFGSYLRDVKSRASSARPSSVGPGVRFDDNVSVSTINDDTSKSPDILTANSDKLTEPFRASRPTSSVASRRSFKVLSTDRLTASLKSASLVDTPSPVSTRYSYDDAFVEPCLTRAVSARPRRRRRPPSQTRVGSGQVRGRQTTNQTGDEPNVKLEHRKQQLLRRQKRAAQKEAEGKGPEGQGPEGEGPEGEGQVKGQTQGHVRRQRQGREEDDKNVFTKDSLAESILEGVEDDFGEDTQQTVLSPSGSSDKLGDEKLHAEVVRNRGDEKPADSCPTSVPSKRSSIASQDADPSGISSVVIRQADSVITDHVINPDEVPGDRGIVVKPEEDGVSISSSVLEEQDIDLPSDDEAKSLKWSDPHETRHTQKPLPTVVVKDKCPVTITPQEEIPFEGEFELDVQTQIGKEGDLSLNGDVDILDEDDIYDDDGDYDDGDYEDEDYDDYEEYDDFEEEDFDEGATQPLMPQYTGTLFSRAASFSFDNTLAESQDLDNIVIDDSVQMLPHTVDSLAGSRPDTRTQEESESEAPTPSAPPPSPPGSRMSKADSPKQAPSQALSGGSRPASVAVSVSPSQGGSAPPSRAGSAQPRLASKASRKSLTGEQLPTLVASTESFDRIKEPSSSRSTPVSELVPPEYLKEHQFGEQSEAGRTVDSGFGGTYSLKQDSATDSRSTFQNDSPGLAPSRPITVKLPSEMDDSGSKEDLLKSRVSFKPTPKTDAWKPPHEPTDVTKAVGISSTGTKSVRPTSSDGHRSPSIPKHLMGLTAQKKALKLEAENAKVNKQEKEVEAMLTSDLTNKYEEGMTVEELELEQKILEEKMKKAEQVVSGVKEEKGKRKGIVKKEPMQNNQKRRGLKSQENQPLDLEAQRKALQEQKLEEKKRRLEEAMAMQAQIMEKEVSKKKELEEAAKKTAEIEEQMAALADEAQDAEQLEEDAKIALIAARKSAREEREIRRKQEQERRRQEAASKRKQEWEMMERAKKKEMEMLAKIRGVEAQRQLQEEERLRREAEEDDEMERLEEEERLGRIAAEEEEARIAAIEAQAEEEALSRLRWERDEAERKRRKLMVEAERLAAEEDKKRQAFLEEQRIADEERQKIEDEENRKREEERQRLIQLKKMEEEAREQMRQEFDKRREMLLKRREKNLEARNHLQGVRTSQGMTRPWTFSYYVLWPRDTYERLIGGEEDSKKKKGAFRRKPKPKSAPPKS